VILVIDNYDSFTFNLVQALQAAGAEVLVVRNDAIGRAGIEALADDPGADLRGIVISPGPGDPDDAGVSVEAIRVAAERRIPLLGVCLGMQSMGAAFGARIVRAPSLVHGESSAVTHDGRGLLAGLPQGFQAARYHSLVVDAATLPDDVETTATAEEGAVLMGIRHRSLPMEGVQFHPESVLTPQGPHLLANFLRLAGEGDAGILDLATGSFATRGLGAAPAEDGEATQDGAAAPSPTGASAPPPAASAASVTAPAALAPSAGADAVHHALLTVVDGGSLSFDDARDAMGGVMDGEATPAQLAALLVALRMRGETTDELAGFAAAMRSRVLHVDAPPGAVDTVGTGGDRSGTFNISTASALVVAAAGVPVAKHGNRAITSRAGSADAIDALGIRIDHDAASAATDLRELGFAFLFAPAFHPAMRHAGPTRREIGVRTAFNLLGPLTNPAGVRRLVVGSGDPAAAPRLAAVLARLGDERAFVVHGAGVDELPLDGTGVLYDVSPAGITREDVVAARYGLIAAPTSALAGGDPEENAVLVEAVLAGERGPRLDVVLLNAAATLAVAGRVGSIAEGIALARATIGSGAASALLARLRASRLAHEAAAAATTTTVATSAAAAARSIEGAAR
jgi:anthranilate synthase/phosphoribosyltransferase